jgi:serine protease Do
MHQKTTTCFTLLRKRAFLTAIIAGSILAGHTAYAFAQDPIDNVQFETAIEDVAEAVGPAIVSIRRETIRKVEARGYMFGVPMGDKQFKEFFNHFFGVDPNFQQRQQGLGSGVIIDSQGHILTNAHVVRDADKISVTLSDGRVFSAEVVGADERSDLAVIKIDANNLPTAKLGESENLKIGQWVIAIGNPFAHLLPNPEPTVTVGVISALERTLAGSLKDGTTHTALIQTDAAINPGNSGGPLLNLRGEVIGINVAIFSTSGGYQGIGFAIPVDTVKRVSQRLIAGKKVTYGWLGIAIQNIDQALARYFGVNPREGVLVTSVLDNSPAKEAGLREKDIITDVNEKGIKSSFQLINVISAISPGQTVTLNIIRDRQPREIRVQIGDRPQMGRQTQREEPEKESVSTPNEWRGLRLRDISPAQAKRLGLETTEGLLITDITLDSPGETAGLRKGMVIQAVNDQPVKDLDDFKELTQNEDREFLIKTQQGFHIVGPMTPSS